MPFHVPSVPGQGGAADPLDVPLVLEVVDYLPNPHAPAALAQTPERVTWYLQLGAYTHETARSAAKTMPDAVLAALLAGFGLEVPCDEARSDPVRALGPLAGAVVTAALVPSALRPRGPGGEGGPAPG